MLDYALVQPQLTEADIVAGCEIAKRYHIAAVSVNSCYVALVSRLLAGSDVAAGSTVSFPQGSSTTATKVAEAREALANGATELDMVLNIGELRAGHAEYVREEIRAVVQVARAHPGTLVKVILENAYLTDAQKVLGCHLAEEAGADFLKTSTGFAPSGASVADVRLMRASVGPHVQVKAAQGIKTAKIMLALIDAGATRIGASSVAGLLEDLRNHAL
jgi:deoxyribose-phosphate aldolase